MAIQIIGTNQCRHTRAADNIIIERFWRILKYQKVYLLEYSSIEDVCYFGAEPKIFFILPIIASSVLSWNQRRTKNLTRCFLSRPPIIALKARTCSPGSNCQRGEIS
jgi:hypothetical protein